MAYAKPADPRKREADDWYLAEEDSYGNPRKREALAYAAPEADPEADAAADAWYAYYGYGHPGYYGYYGLGWGGYYGGYYGYPIYGYRYWKRDAEAGNPKMSSVESSLVFPL